ncbi:MAG: MazG family protein [Lachnospiraceae bacterium]|nr:MazG family protein [Clostridiales bacterium]MDD6036071.1 MazG family protein [Lachnospiraceae bacterium]
MDKKYNFDDFCGIIEQLRSENGCPWDKAQTHSSLKQCMIEEAYEVLQGIDEYEESKNFDNLREELGDVLLQVVMHSVIAKEEGLFTIDDVIDEVAAKMVRRHPHVFGNHLISEKEEIHKNWEEIKKEEKKSKNQNDGISSIPLAFPALIRAQKVVKKCEKLKIEKEILFQEELFPEKLAIILDDKKCEDNKKEALGSLLFELCKLAQIQHFNAEECLSECVKQYIRTKE